MSVLSHLMSKLSVPILVFGALLFAFQPVLAQVPQPKFRKFLPGKPGINPISNGNPGQGTPLPSSQPGQSGLGGLPGGLGGPSGGVAGFGGQPGLRTVSRPGVACPITG